MATIKKNNLFSKRHIGVNSQDRDFMLQSIGYGSMDSFIDAVVPENILEKEKIDLGEEKTEEESAIVESVKAASDVYAPLSGEVIEVNEKLLDEPEIVNSSPLEDGWFFKIKLNDATSFENLMTEDEYNATCEE